eukprot:6321070-Alexandrium_andersonii.AAC.1
MCIRDRPCRGGRPRCPRRRRGRAGTHTRTAGAGGSHARSAPCSWPSEPAGCTCARRRRSGYPGASGPR